MYLFTYNFTFKYHPSHKLLHNITATLTIQGNRVKSTNNALDGSTQTSHSVCYYTIQSVIIMLVGLPYLWMLLGFSHLDAISSECDLAWKQMTDFLKGPNLIQCYNMKCMLVSRADPGLEGDTKRLSASKQHPWIKLDIIIIRHQLIIFKRIMCG